MTFTGKSTGDRQEEQAAQTARIIHLYQDGLCSEEIAPLVGCSWRTVLRRLDQAGVPRRKAADYDRWSGEQNPA